MKYQGIIHKYQTLLAFIVVLAAAICVFEARLGFAFVLPWNNGALFVSDPASHYLSWEFFRALPWSWPLGLLENYMYPITTSIGFTDAIPLFAFTFKLLGPLLPKGDFQYIGFWLLTCFILQGVFAVLLLRDLRVSRVQIILGALFFVLSPVLLIRIHHAALCAQWLLLASLWVYFKPPAPRDPWIHISLLLLSALIHPYLTVMVWFCFVAYIVRRMWIDKSSSVFRALLFVGGGTIAMLAIWYAVGYFVMPPDAAWANKDFTVGAANLITFINPLEYSALFEEIPYLGKMEGFAYFGLGMYALIVLVILGKKQEAIKKQDLIWVAPLAAILFACFLFSLSSTVRFGMHELFAIPLPEWAMKLASTFRASGRFVWPLYYALMVAVFWSVSRLRAPQTWVTVFMCVALLLQVYDISPLLERKYEDVTPYQPQLGEEWDALAQDAEMLVMYPPFQHRYVEPQDYTKFVYLALQNDIPITTGYLARQDMEGQRAYKTGIAEALEHGYPDRGALYITRRRYAPEFERWVKEELVELLIIDRYYVYHPI